MAKGKNNIIIYKDWYEDIKELSDEEAGQLFKHMMAYVNDENPKPPSRIIELLFAPWKKILKRDLEKWLSKSQKNREIAEKRWGKKSEEEVPKHANASSGTDSVPKSTTDADNGYWIMDNGYSIMDKSFLKLNSLMSKIEISDVPQQYQEYFKIAEQFRKLFIKNLTERQAPTINQKNAKVKAYVNPIRLMMEIDNITKEQLIKAYQYLDSKDSEFWKKNILSTEKLRKQIDKLLMDANKKKTAPAKAGQSNKPVRRNV